MASLSLPKTRAQWTLLVAAICAILVFLYFFTPVFNGHAVEVSLENDGENEIFASIDNTGRHGDVPGITAMHTTGNSETSPGLRLRHGQSRSFGMAVGMFDSPTLHIWQINESGLAVADSTIDCPFDTVNFKKIEIPSIHKKIKWTGEHCEIVE